MKVKQGEESASKSEGKKNTTIRDLLKGPGPCPESGEQGNGKIPKNGAGGGTKFQRWGEPKITR